MKLPFSVFLACVALSASAQQNQPPRRDGPPPEFIDACKGKKDGDTAKATTPHGDTVSGKCRMVLLPEHPRKQK